VKTPPAASIRLGASLAYRGVVIFLAILLIAAYALFIWPTGVFNVKNGLAAAVAVLALAAALWDAWRPRAGALHYAAGQWVLAQEGVEAQGTLQVALDLPSYLLVRFTPSAPIFDSAVFSPPAPQWLHLEPRHGQDWRALRRALFAAPALGDTLHDTPEPKPL
jgi:hypothetical protein